MYCKKQLDGSCIEDRCQSIRLSENEAGCGIDGRRALDLVMSTSTSQTEVVASLVEVEHVSDLRNEAKGFVIECNETEKWRPSCFEDFVIG